MKRMISLLVWSSAFVALAMAICGLTECHSQIATGGSLGIGGASATGGNVTKATGGRETTGGTSAQPSTIAQETEFPPCMNADTAGLKWKPAVERPLGWRRTPATQQLRNMNIVPQALPKTSVLWQPNDLYNLDQPMGGCVGFAWDGCLATQPFQAHMSEESAEANYHQATILDDIAGTWPPDDTGSTVLAGAKAVVYLGKLQAFDAAWSVSDVLTRLRSGPGVIGTDWRQGMFSTDNCGHLDMSGPVKGGHAWFMTGDDAVQRRVWGITSWGQFGVKDRRGRYGYFWMTHDEFTELFSHEAEAYFPRAPVK